MSKYICVEDFANELKDFCCKPCKENGEHAEGWKCGSCSVMYLVGAVDAFSAADVEPVIHAKWICVDMPFNNVYVCSNCRAIDSDCSDGLSTHRVMLQERCPQCGAKMDKE